MAEFHKHPKNGVRPRCRACRKAEWDAGDHKAYHKAYYAKNREKKLAANREWRLANVERQKAYDREYSQKNKEVLRSKTLVRNYGITLEQWQEIFEAQGKVCRICGSADPKNKRGWHTDHGVTVRGILCHHCNTGLGAFNHDAGRLKAAIRYLAK